MSSPEPLRKVVRNLADTFNNPQIRESSYFDFYDNSLIIHGFPPNIPTNKEGFKQFIYSLWRAFPDIRIIFEDIIIEGNKVAGRYYLNGTHNGEFLDIQATGKQFKVNGMTVFSFRDTKIMERWNLVDIMSLIEQLKAKI
jgi:predicted ester cyclase